MSQRVKRESPGQASASQEWEIAPLRSINDFLLDGLWNIPDFSDNERLNNRVINNLIYYQTNYFVLGIAVILLFG